MLIKTIIDKNKLLRTQRILLILALIGMLLPVNYSSFLLIVFVGFSIFVQIIYKETVKKFNKFALIFSGFFLFYVISVFTSNNQEIALKIE